MITWLKKLWNTPTKPRKVSAVELAPHKALIKLCTGDFKLCEVKRTQGGWHICLFENLGEGNSILLPEGKIHGKFAVGWLPHSGWSREELAELKMPNFDKEIDHKEAINGKKILH